MELTWRLTRDCLRSWLWPEAGAAVVIYFGEHARIVATVKYYKAVNNRSIVMDA